MKTLWLTFALGGLALTSACTGAAYVDGYDAVYVENPPPDIAVYPRYPFHDGYVYDVSGRYYHHHEGRWVAYPRRPREVAHYPRR